MKLRYIPLIASASAWWDTGHLLVARIAQDLILQQEPLLVEHFNDVLQVLREKHPELTVDESYEHGFVESATFADELYNKYNGTWQFNWHFVDTPLLDEGKTLDDYPDFKVQAQNSTETIKNLVAFLRKEPGYEDGYAYKTLMDHMNGDTSAAKSMALRLLIHYVGDIHQPLHAVSRLNEEYPEGDMGGNLFKIAQEDLGNLHSLWDSVILTRQGYAQLPLSTEDWDELTKQAEALLSSHQVEDTLTKNLDPLEWASESFHFAKNFTYTAQPGQKVTQEYLKDGIQIAERRITLAGYRLANLLLTLDGPKKQVLVQDSNEPKIAKIPLVHLPRENLYHGVVYVGSENTRMQVFYDTMLDQTLLNVKHAEGALIESNLDLGAENSTAQRVYQSGNEHNKLTGSIFYGAGAAIKFDGSYWNDTICMAQSVPSKHMVG